MKLLLGYTLSAVSQTCGGFAQLSVKDKQDKKLNTKALRHEGAKT